MQCNHFRALLIHNGSTSSEHFKFTRHGLHASAVGEFMCNAITSEHFRFTMLALQDSSCAMQSLWCELSSVVFNLKQCFASKLSVSALCSFDVLGCEPSETPPPDK